MHPDLLGPPDVEGVQGQEEPGPKAPGRPENPPAQGDTDGHRRHRKGYGKKPEAERLVPAQGLPGAQQPVIEGRVGIGGRPDGRPDKPEPGYPQGERLVVPDVVVGEPKDPQAERRGQNDNPD